jgi:hypothetical protein
MAWSPKTPRLSLLWGDRLHKDATRLVPPRQRQMPLCGVETACHHLRNDGWAWRYLNSSPNLDAGLAAVPDRW